MATAGVYYFRRGTDYIKYANRMIKKKLSVQGVYFVCPVFNELIADKGKVRSFPIESMWSFSTPEDVKLFINQF